MTSPDRQNYRKEPHPTARTIHGIIRLIQSVVRSVRHRDDTLGNVDGAQRIEQEEEGMKDDDAGPGSLFRNRFRKWLETIFENAQFAEKIVNTVDDLVDIT